MAANLDDSVETLLVFQCQQCRLIVGDSTAFRGGDATARTISLGAMSSVAVAPAAGGNGGNEPNVAEILKCAGCGQVLGHRQAGEFTVRTGAISTYQVGAHQVAGEADVNGSSGAVISVPDATATIASSVGVSDDAFRNLLDKVQEDADRIQVLESTLAKVQQMLLLYHGRLVELESQPRSIDFESRLVELESKQQQVVEPPAGSSAKRSRK